MILLFAYHQLVSLKATNITPTTPFPADHKNGLNSPPIQGNSPRNSSPMQDGGNLTNNLSTLDVTDKLLQMSLNNDKADLHLDDHSSSGLGTSGNSSSCQNGTGSNGDHNSFGQYFLDKLPDRRAPGCEMKSLQLAAQKHLDYDQKKLMATRAMQSKPAGEPRTPTPSWAGLGFSNSMPEHVIKEKLAAEERASAAQRKSNLVGVTEELEDSSNDSSAVFKENTEADASPWFGNSSAFDALLNASKMNSQGNVAILPTDDLPTVFAKQVSLHLMTMPILIDATTFKGLAKYTDLFVRHEVDLQTFASLTEQDLREIGIHTFGARKKLLLLANSEYHLVINSLFIIVFVAEVKQTLSKTW